MKKMLILVLVVLVCAGVAMAQTYTQGQGIIGIDKLGAHQNGGRGCVGCHTPHSGVRGNGGALTGSSVLTTTAGNKNSASGNTYSWSSQTTPSGDYGDQALWGQDIGPVLGLGTIGTGDSGSYVVNLATATTTQPSIKTGIVFCLSCHDGNVAKGAMMTNQSFEQAAGLLPSTYGSQPIPTLLGNDAGSAGNYQNDHPIGQQATLGAVGISSYLAFDNAAAPTKLILNPVQPNANYTTFENNYGLPQILSRSSFVVESNMTSVSQAYVVCTTCHTPHSMYTTTASASNPIATKTSGTFPTYFFIAAPYNPGANTAGGTMASSATQFCRQCHFSGAGGSNESAGIMTVATAF